MNTRRGLSLLVALIFVAQACFALAEGLVATPKRGALAPQPAAATVGSRRITRAELDRRTTLAAADFARRQGQAQLPPEVRDLVRRQMLESMIRLELLGLEAERTGVGATVEEAEDVLRKEPIFNPGGVFDAARFQAIKTTQKPAYDEAIRSLRGQVAARKMSERLEAQFAPDPAVLRAEALRSLTTLDADHLTLRRGDFDGSFAEPREDEVVRAYRARPADYERPARTTLTVAYVNTPGLSDEERAVPATVEAWERRMKAVADSVLAVIRGGKSFDEAAGFLGPRGGTVVAPDNFPGNWRATSAQQAKLFDTAMSGKVLPEAVKAQEGWMILRADQVAPLRVAPLREVVREVRGRLRRDLKQNHTEYELRSLYARMRDTLAAPGVRMRYVVADTARIAIAPPSAGDLDRYYRAHIADYSMFDTRAGAIRTRPLTEVADDVRVSYLRDARVRQAALLAERVRAAWEAGKSDAAAETQLGVRDPGTVPRGALPDSTREARVLADTLWRGRQGVTTGKFAVPGGWIVWHVDGAMDRVTPSFPQARAQVEKALAAETARTELAGARQLFDADPKQFGGERIISYTIVPVMPPTLLSIPLTKEEVVSFHRANIDRYSAPEVARARHILIEPADSSPAADAAALQRANDLLARLRAGADFAQLARDNSADAPTRDKGGDLGVFGHGTMLEAIERAVFSAAPGELISAPVRTEVGYHVIRVEEHEPAVVQPLEWIYANVASDCALEKGGRLASVTADSILRISRTPQDVLRSAEAKGYTVSHMTYRTGMSIEFHANREMLEALGTMRPGELPKQVFSAKGRSFWIAWVDSIAEATQPTWEDAREAAIQLYRRGAGQRAMEAKQAEIDSLMAGGWSFDSLATMWGGPEKLVDLVPGKGIPGLGGAAAFDSVAFGTGTHAAIAVGQVSTWIRLTNGVTRIRVAGREEPTREVLTARVAGLRASMSETRQRDYYEELKKRYKVQILEPRMREIQLGNEPAVPARR